MVGIEKIKKNDIPKVQRFRGDLLKNKLFPEFEKITGDEALKIDCKEIGCSLAGVRYVMQSWNETSEKKITYDSRNTRTNPVVYVYIEK